MLRLWDREVRTVASRLTSVSSGTEMSCRGFVPWGPLSRSLTAFGWGPGVARRMRAGYNGFFLHLPFCRLSANGRGQNLASLSPFLSSMFSK